ncbi:hypothetical protein CU097_014089 [Rhizopus azygosporus]|uniref:Uncharacterized protein n=1 Tax=Rhizopus azygosporus TaxID=86630 RepID=A0A367KGT5_RHIAZ|nr:hypothetical protein CU097_014089 [Rhizopus azygosporus]
MFLETAVPKPILVASGSGLRCEPIFWGRKNCLGDRGTCRLLSCRFEIIPLEGVSVHAPKFCVSFDEFDIFALLYRLGHLPPILRNESHGFIDFSFLHMVFNPDCRL